MRTAVDRRVRDDHHRTLHLVEQPRRHRAENGGTDGTVATCTHHQEVGIVGYAGQFRAWSPLDEVPFDLGLVTPGCSEVTSSTTWSTR